MCQHKDEYIEKYVTLIIPALRQAIIDGVDIDLLKERASSLVNDFYPKATAEQLKELVEEAIRRVKNGDDNIPLLQH